jgi:hypothetical protein
MTASVDSRPIGQVTISGARSGVDLRWTADVATDHNLGRFAVARVGDQAWIQAPGGAWTPVLPEQVAPDGLDNLVLAAALTSDLRTTAENRGLEFIDGARARHCRIEVDGPNFVAAFPEVNWFVGSDPLSHWRGELDYWIFSDGEVGLVQGLVSGEAEPLGRSGIVGTIAVTLDATERDQFRSILAPG